jgi:hypothetical protein
MYNRKRIVKIWVEGIIQVVLEEEISKAVSVIKESSQIFQRVTIYSERKS